MEKRELVPFNDPDLIVLRNPVARARFNLSVYQIKFLLEILSYLKNRPDERIIEFNIRAFNNSLEVETNNLSFYVNEIRKMVHHVISIPTEERKDGGIRFKEVALISGIDTDIDGKGEGYIKIEVAQMIKPYFLEIANGQFFSFHKQNSKALKSRYSINLYILLKSYQRLRVFTVKYEELRNILEIAEHEYNPFKEFKRWVLERSRNEMLEKNDIYFDFDVVRIGGKLKGTVDKLVFHIKENTKIKGKIKQELAIIEPNIFQPEIIRSGENWEAIGRKLGSKKRVEEVMEMQPSMYQEIEKLYRFFDKETSEDILSIFITGLNAQGYSNERILDVLHYAKNTSKKGENIRNIMSYMKKGLESGIMGQGMARAEKNKNQQGAEHEEIGGLFESNMFKNYLLQYYIQKGSDADNDLKLQFVEVVKKQTKYAGMFDASGKIKDSQKDKFREMLGKLISEKAKESSDMIFQKWIQLTQEFSVKKEKGKWVKVFE